MIQAIYKSVEIELEMIQQADDYWKCDIMLITHPDRRVTRIKGRIQLPTLRMTKEYAIEEAQVVIDTAEELGLSVHEVGLVPVLEWAS